MNKPEPTTTQAESLPAQRRALAQQIADLVEAFEAANPDLAVDDIDVIRENYYVHQRGAVRIDVDVKVW